ncbi:sulfotransferase [Gracilaria domingensis]|nr:sulfotransferase [Gracilaria domingensis]
MSLKDQAVRKAIYPKYFMEYFLECDRLPDGSYPEACKRLSKWFKHVKSWTEHDKGRTLYLIYEDVIKDIPNTIQTISKFLSVPVTEKQIHHVASRCERSWMASNPRTRARTFSKAFGLDESKSCRTRRLDAFSFRDVELPVFCQDACWRMFHDAVGLETYNELVDELRSRNELLFACLKI